MTEEKRNLAQDDKTGGQDKDLKKEEIKESTEKKETKEEKPEVQAEEKEVKDEPKQEVKEEKAEKTEEKKTAPEKTEENQDTEEIVESLDDVDFEKMLEEYENWEDLKNDTIIKGKVIAVRDDDIVVDIGYKSEGEIPISEFEHVGVPEVGSEIDVYVVRLEDSHGNLVLSNQKAQIIKVWDTIKETYKNDDTIKGIVTKKVKGGLIVNLFGINAFLPASLVALKPLRNYDQFIGKKIEVKVINLNKNRRNVIVSRKAILAEEANKKKKVLFEKLEKGQETEGIVKNITDFGVFVDLGGADGLLHITDLSWGRVKHPKEIVNLGDKINVMILEIDKENEKISLGKKQLEPYPWENVEEKYPEGSRVRGKVVSVTDYGAFVEIEKGVEGLIHISEFSWTKHIKHPSEMMNVNDIVEAVVLKVDRENERISLGIKQLEPDPWMIIDDKYPVGTKIKGKIRNVTPFGAFMEVEEGIDGLIHISDMSWTKRITHPSELLHKGDEVEVVVLNIDADQKRIALGLKQAQHNPWENIEEKYPVDEVVNGVIKQVVEKGLVVELEEDVEAFVPISHTTNTGPVKGRLDAIFENDSEVTAKIIEVQPERRKIVISIREYLRDKEREENPEAYEAKKAAEEQAAKERRERRQEAQAAKTSNKRKEKKGSGSGNQVYADKPQSTLMKELFEQALQKKQQQDEQE